tara:strand:- start:890 stop:1000 length:111 start_codon:yes stop_codon:yes gene_type:complete
MKFKIKGFGIVVMKLRKEFSPYITWLGSLSQKNYEK